MKRIFVLAVVAAVVAVCMAAWAGMIQGQYLHMTVHLTDAEGQPFPPRDDYCFKFVIYNDADRSVSLWERALCDVAVTEDGYINVTLGSISGSVFDSGDGMTIATRYIQIWAIGGTGDDLLIGSPYPIPYHSEDGMESIVLSTAIFEPQFVSLIDTHGDTVRWFLNYNSSSGAAGTGTDLVRTGQRIQILEQRLKAIEEKIRER